MTDKEKNYFSELLQRAKGDLSLEDFSRLTGISKFQLSRIMNGKFKGVPRKSTINAIAENSQDEKAKEILSLYCTGNHVFYEDGDENELSTNNLENLINFISKKQKGEKNRELENACKGLILAAACSFKFDWIVKYNQIDSNIPRDLQPLLRIELPSHTSVNIWDFYFQPDDEQYKKGYFYALLGRIISSKVSENHKVSLVVSDVKIYNELKHIPIHTMDIKFSFLLIDMKKQNVEMEDYINDKCKWDDVKNISLSGVTLPISQEDAALLELKLKAK